MSWLRSSSIPFAAILIGSFATGCSEELGPRSIPTSHVDGSVTVAGLPVRSGWIEFIPSEGTVGNMRVARIGPDGSYSVDRVAVGTVAIGLTNVVVPPNSGGLSQAYATRFNGFQTPIRKQIAPGSVTRINVDLADEWLALQIH